MDRLWKSSEQLQREKKLEKHVIDCNKRLDEIKVNGWLKFATHNKIPVGSTKNLNAADEFDQVNLGRTFNSIGSGDNDVILDGNPDVALVFSYLSNFPSKRLDGVMILIIFSDDDADQIKSMAASSSSSSS